MADFDLLDFLLKGTEYCVTTSSYDECLKDPKSYYVNHSLKACEAPNRYFEAHQELLYTVDSGGKKECLLEKSYKDGISIEAIKFVEKLIVYNKETDEIFIKNLDLQSKKSPEKLEDIIIKFKGRADFKILREKITEELSKNNNFKYRDELLKCYQEDLEKTRRGGYKDSIINLFTVQAVYHDEGDEYFKIVVNYAKCQCQ